MLKLSKRACGLGLLLASRLTGCQYQEQGTPSSYVVQVAGSPTVSPISSAVAEEADKVLGIKATVETTGTGPGMERLIRKECDITGASRPIKESELEACRAGGFEPIEFSICIDGISVVVNPGNDWCSCLSVEQLKKLWAYDSKVKKWSDLDPSWPKEDIKLFGPDSESGTFEYFNEAIIGKVPEGQSPCRIDYTPSVNDTMLVDGVKGNKYSLGYFGYAYYVMNKSSLKAIGVAKSADLSDCVEPNQESIESGQYAPLSRPLFIYVNQNALQQKPEVARFVEYFLNDGQSEVAEVGYIELPIEKMNEARETLKKATSAAPAEK